MNYDIYVTGEQNPDSPMNQKEIEAEQVTIDQSYYSQLVKISKLTKKYFKILDSPWNYTSDDVQEMNDIKKKIKKLL